MSNQLIQQEDAKKLFSQSVKRREEIIKHMNIEIQKAVLEGKDKFPFPSPLTKIEADWLREELILAKYSVLVGEYWAAL